MAGAATDTHPRFFSAMGGDIRMMREQLGISQEEICNLMGWGRFALSKIENGKTNLSLFEYLRLMSLLQEANKDHPAFLLLNRYGGRKAISGKQ
jgi:predicted transcriptional regulator